MTVRIRFFCVGFSKALPCLYIVIKKVGGVCLACLLSHVTFISSPFVGSTVIDRLSQPADLYIVLISVFFSSSFFVYLRCISDKRQKGPNMGPYTANIL